LEDINRNSVTGSEASDSSAAHMSNRANDECEASQVHCALDCSLLVFEDVLEAPCDRRNRLWFSVEKQAEYKREQPTE